MLLQFCAFATSSGFVPQYASLLGADKSQLGMLAALASFSRALASLLAGSLLAKLLQPRKLVALGFALLAAVTLALPYLATLTMLFVSQALAGVGIGLIFTLLMSLCLQNTAPSQKGAAMGFFQAVYGIGMISGPVLLGFLADRAGLSLGFTVVGLVTLAAAGLAWFTLSDSQH
jgi:MFS family permease